jgi:chitin synthase
MYLAEDRVLCLSLVSKKKEKYFLKYIKNSVATTDVPNTFQVLLSQRRRWINGSWHALIDAMRVFSKINKSSHSCCRKMVFWFQLLYFFANVMFTWLMVGALFVVLAVIMRFRWETNGQDQTDGDEYEWTAADYMILTYVILLITVFILSIGVKPAKVELLYLGLVILFG